MDCRGPWLLALALTTGAVGCSHKAGFTVPPQDVPADAVVRKEADGPKKQPQTSTLISFGTLYERMAADPKYPPAAQDEMRDKARKSFQQALKIDPKCVQASAGLARLHTATGDHERAIALYGKTLKAHPKEAGLWFELGMCHGRQKDWQKAVGCLGKAADLQPDNRQYANHLGFCLARAGYFDESFKAFRRVEGEAVAHYNVARMLHHVQRDDQSKHRLRLALQANPQLAQAQQFLMELENPAPRATPDQLPPPSPVGQVDVPQRGGAVQPAGYQPGSH